MALLSGAGFAGDTIFALASGAGRSAISVVRLSGPGCNTCLSALAGGLPAPRYASLRNLRDGAGALLDRALVLWFPAPGSYTGEDAAELHLHGGRAVLDAVTAALLERGARPASPGEFTRRAFLNGKIDLLEAEAVGDLVAAETSTQRLHALKQASGTLSRLVTGWMTRLTHSLACQEALIDFADDVPAHVERKMRDDLRALRDELQVNIGEVSTGQRLREGLVFAIIGPPNAGKSSLINALAKHDVAIVSDCPGTTRDAIRAEVVLGDVPVTLIDTAGLCDSDNAVEAEGVRRARQHAASADLVIEVADSRVGRSTGSPAPHLCLGNKTDLAPSPAGCFGISLLTGAGLPELRALLAQKAQELANPGSNASFSGARHAAALRDAESSVAAALDATQPELSGEELRLALQALGRITGNVSSEVILDAVFNGFCIGK